MKVYAHKAAILTNVLLNTDYGRIERTDLFTHTSRNIGVKHGLR